LIALGILIYNDSIYKLSRFTVESEYVQDIIIQGEELLKKFFVHEPIFRSSKIEN
jgi:hypothetical protein